MQTQEQQKQHQNMPRQLTHEQETQNNEHISNRSRFQGYRSEFQGKNHKDLFVLHENSREESKKMQRQLNSLTRHNYKRNFSYIFFQSPQIDLSNRKKKETASKCKHRL